MQIEKTINFATNYTVTKATDKVLAKIYADAYWIFDWKKCLNWHGKLLKSVQKKIPELLRNYKGKFSDQLQVWKGHNIVPSIIRNELALLISWSTPSTTFKANYMALWNWSLTPANTDLQLWNETVRWSITNGFSVDNTAYLDKFFSTAEVSGLTVTECGVFVDWTASANTWFLLSRILMNESMAANETLTINCTITIV